MGDLLKQSTQTVLAYAGNGLLTLYFLVALVYLLAREKDKGNRSVLTVYPIAVIMLFFIPLTPYIICEKAGETETLYRFLWLIPMTTVSAYATILFLSKIKYKVLKFILCTVAMVCVAIGGNPGYQSPVMVPAENVYQIPQDVIDLCDYMIVPGREVECAFPFELTQYVRQYTTYVVLPYGYETLVERWRFTDDLSEEMFKDVSDAGNLARLLRENGCHYVVLNKDHVVDGDLEDYDYHLVYSTKQYLLYFDQNSDISVP